MRKWLAHWCSRLTRCPLKAEITGSSPVCAANFLSVSQEIGTNSFFNRLTNNFHEADSLKVSIFALAFGLGLGVSAFWQLYKVSSTTV